jgi:hypothetical protein
VKTYPFCAKKIQDAAIKCEQCGRVINSATPTGMTVRPEIDITPGMINAGVKEFRTFRRDENCTTEIVRAVYSAMHERFLLDQKTEQAAKCREQSPAARGTFASFQT